ncbi:SRPBCC domain-containing protein [Arthrobacter sp. GCM10027362]|uniref:SRPBCC family protein n=1 Tax=Arthrobacter sp. GCM10027362 TaxID=3273379 RepID=UPI00363C1988
MGAGPLSNRMTAAGEQPVPGSRHRRLHTVEPCLDFREARSIMSEFRRRGHWRRGRDGKQHWVSEHTVNRTSSSPRWSAPAPQARPSFRVTDTRPTYNPPLSIFDFTRPSPDRPADWAKLSRIRNARCPVCGQAVYFYANELGSKVYFDDLGPPWPKHPCTDVRNSGTSGAGGVREPRGSSAPFSGTPATVTANLAPAPTPPSPRQNEAGVVPGAAVSPSPAANEWTMTFDCSVGRLWEAWSSRDALARWFHPPGSSTPGEGISLDLQRGGSLRYTLLDARAGTRDRLVCAFRAVEPGEHLIFKWGPAAQESNLTVAVRVAFVAESGGGSSLRIRVTDLSVYRDSRVLAHWKDTFDNLRSFVESPLPSIVQPDVSHPGKTAQAQPLDRSEMEKRPDNAARTKQTPHPVVSPPTAPPVPLQRVESEQQGWLVRFRRFWTGR